MVRLQVICNYREFTSIEKLCTASLAGGRQYSLYSKSLCYMHVRCKPFSAAGERHAIVICSIHVYSASVIMLPALSFHKGSVVLL